MFAEKLEKGVEKAKNQFGFGRSVGKNGRFDSDFFLKQGSGKDSYLRLRSDKSPAQAMDAMFSPDAKGKWTFDCFEFAEVIQLHALRESLGHTPEGTAKFNDTVKEAFKKTNTTGSLEIKPRPESGLPVGQWFHAETDHNKDLDESKFVNGPLTARGNLTMTQAQAANAGIGALVTFYNPNFSDAHPDMENENTISIGGGKFVAWGEIAGPGKFILGADEIRQGLASKGRKRQAWQDVFITGVTIPAIQFR